MTFSVFSVWQDQEQIHCGIPGGEGGGGGGGAVHLRANRSQCIVYREFNTKQH